MLTSVFPTGKKQKSAMEETEYAPLVGSASKYDNYDKY